MIRTVALLAFVASSSAWLLDNPWKSGLSQNFPGYEKVPRTYDDAIDDGWVKIEGPPRPAGYEDLTTYMKLSEPTTAILIDETYGNVAGLIILIPVDEVTPYYDMAEQGFTLFSLTIDGKIKEFHVSFILFVSDDKATRKYDKNQVLQTNYVAYQNNYGQLERAPIDLSEIKNNQSSVWTKQNCMILMGSHYYYKMYETTTCDKPFHPFFLLFEERTHQLIGMGMMVLGKCTGKTFESPNTAAVKIIVNHGPQCLYELVAKYGACTRHMMWVDNPLLINCI